MKKKKKLKKNIDYPNYTITISLWREKNEWKEEELRKKERTKEEEKNKIKIKK